MNDVVRHRLLCVDSRGRRMRVAAVEMSERQCKLNRQSEKPKPRLKPDV